MAKHVTNIPKLHEYALPQGGVFGFTSLRGSSQRPDSARGEALRKDAYSRAKPFLSRWKYRSLSIS